MEAKKRRKAERKAQSVGLAIEAAASSKQEVTPARKTAEQSTPIAFVFPGQGSQAVGMLQVRPVTRFEDFGSKLKHFKAVYSAAELTWACLKSAAA